MMEYKLYPNLPSALPDAPPEVGYDLNVVQAKRRGLIAKEQIFKKIYEKYTKILNRLMWLNACSSGISISTGISSVATLATFIGIPVSAALGAASMTGAISGLSQRDISMTGVISGLSQRDISIQLTVEKANESDHLADYLDLTFIIDSGGNLSTRLYDKHDDFDFHIVNFPFLSSNIPSSPSYGVYISQLIRYARCCSHYEDFRYCHKCLVD